MRVQSLLAEEDLVFGAVASSIIYLARGIASLSTVHLLLAFVAGASYILMGKSVVSMKILAIVLMFVGVYLIT